ncbi:hypothetical protein V8C37DRAFT_411699 [Trichoderma ceciliae]
MSGYNDPEKLRAAIELAQSFGKTKVPQQKKVGSLGLGKRQEHWEPYHAGQQSRSSQVIAPSLQTLNYSGSLAPPPSMRNYGSSVTFSTGRAGRYPVIGSLGVDFIRRPSSAVESPEHEQTQTSQAPTTDQTDKIDLQNGNGSNGGTTKPDPIYTPTRSSGNEQYGNILDAFYSILAKKPSIGQEIETLAKMLPKAMDLNAPGNAAPDVSLIKETANSDNRQCTCQGLNGKGIHEKNCPWHMPQEKSIHKVDEVLSSSKAKVDKAKASGSHDDPNNSGAKVETNNGFSYSHSRKLSPVAPVFVPNDNEAQERIASANGECQASIKKSTKGLSASMWA